MSARLLLHFSMIVLSALALSCADKRFKPVYPVSGKVLYQGKPAGGATIRFVAVGVADHPWTRPAADVDEDGSFAVTTYNQHDGMPPGEYKVSIVWVPPGYSGPIERVNKLPARYADPETSGLAVTIKPEPNVLPPFELTK